VQEAVPQRLRLAGLQRDGEGQQPKPGDEVGRDRRGQGPGGVDGELTGREPVDARVLSVPDPALDAGLGAVAGFEERDPPTLGVPGVGGDGLVAPAVGVRTSGQDADFDVRCRRGCFRSTGRSAESPSTLSTR